MKRFHVHIGVEQIDEAVRFYSALFGAPPVKLKADYAKWLLDDPRLNFAISTRTGAKGMDHLGIQAEDEQELTELRERMTAADMAVVMTELAGARFARAAPAPCGRPVAGRSTQSLRSFALLAQTTLG